MKDAPSAVDCTRSIGSEISLESTSGMDREGEVHDKEDSDREASDKEVVAKEVLDEEVSDKEVPNKKVSKSKARKRGIRVLAPTTEQLASLNLKEGRNIVTFTFSTPMLGKQQVSYILVAWLTYVFIYLFLLCVTACLPEIHIPQVDARIYLWRWDTRIVITDVDGTITK